MPEIQELSLTEQYKIIAEASTEEIFQQLIHQTTDEFAANLHLQEINSINQKVNINKVDVGFLGTLGGAGGLVAGGLTGAGIGSVVPVFGTAVGGAIGAIIGGFSGGVGTGVGNVYYQEKQAKKRVKKELENSAISEKGNIKEITRKTLIILAEKLKDERQNFKNELEERKIKIEKFEKTSSEIVEERIREKRDEKELLEELKKQKSSIETVDLESLREKYKNLEKTVETKEKQLEEYIEASNKLEKELELEKEQYNRVATLWQKSREIRRNIEKEKKNLDIEIGSYERKLQNATDACAIQTERLTEARSERDTFEKENKFLKNKLAFAEQEKEQLRTQLANYKKEEPNIFQQTASWIGDKTGFTGVYKGLSNVLFITLALITLLVFSFIWKWIIKPIFKNFFGSSNNNNPPQPKPQPKYTDYEVEEEVVEALPPQPKQIRENRRLEPVEKKNKKRRRKK